VLLVDDEPGIVKMIARRLEAQGYAVRTAGDGEEAMREASSDRPDLLILDVMLPKINGFEVCRRLKENAATRGIPVLMLTAMSQARDRKAGLECGADVYLSKPFRSHEFLEQVKSLLTKTNGNANETRTP
jgi:DNA-binding response OmpR family regulator